MYRYALSRLASAIPTLLVVIAMAFFLTRAAPGGPFDAERRLPDAIEARLEQAYHLDEPLWQQFVRYIGGLVKGDFGPSFRYHDVDVGTLIAQGLPVSLLLGSLALALALIIGLPAGAMAALNHNRWPDRALVGTSLIGLSLPNFVVAPLLVLVFAVTLRWLPAGDLGGPAHWVLPVIALALPQIAYVTRLIRGELLDVLGSGFVRTARAQGLGDATILARHALRPALLPLISYLGPASASLLTGAVVVEQIFGLPGLGRFFVQGAINRDYTLVLGVVVLYSTLIIVFNLIVDLLYGWLDPRVRYR
ncbi:MAG: ABC transporter permease subunit [Pseudomonadota bacterium]